MVSVTVIVIGATEVMLIVAVVTKRAVGTASIDQTSVGCVDVAGQLLASIPSVGLAVTKTAEVLADDVSVMELEAFSVDVLATMSAEETSVDNTAVILLAAVPESGLYSDGP
jgi:hypothetical protein